MLCYIHDFLHFPACSGSSAGKSLALPTGLAVIYAVIITRDDWYGLGQWMNQNSPLPQHQDAKPNLLRRIFPSRALVSSGSSDKAYWSFRRHTERFWTRSPLPRQLPRHCAIYARISPSHPGRSISTTTGLLYVFATPASVRPARRYYGRVDDARLPPSHPAGQSLAIRPIR